MTLISFPPVGQPVSRIPADLEVEQALLGILLYDNAAHERISVPLSPDHMHEPVHARLFGAIEDHIRAGQLADPLTIAQRFERIADMTTNIAEDVIFLVEGRVVRHEG